MPRMKSLLKRVSNLFSRMPQTVFVSSLQPQTATLLRPNVLKAALTLRIRCPPVQPALKRRRAIADLEFESRHPRSDGLKWPNFARFQCGLVGLVISRQVSNFSSSLITIMFKKRTPESVLCEVCNTYVNNRLTHHAYSHMMDADLYICPQCRIGNHSRNQVIKHLKDFHDSDANPIDNRLKFAADIKEKIRACYPSVFVDAPVPTQAEIEQLKKSLNLSDSQLVTDGDDTHDISNENDDDLENEVTVKSLS